MTMGVASSNDRGARLRTLLARTLAAVVLLLAARAAAQEEPEWVKKVPDFRSSWPEPLEIAKPAPDFTLEDLGSGKKVNLAKARDGKRATLLLFLDDNCGTCKRRATDLAASLAGAVKVEGAAVFAIFTANLVKSGAKGAREFAEKAGFPDVPVLHDANGGRAETALAYRVTVAPCAAVLDAEGRLAYFGLALAQSGADLLPGIVARIAEGKRLDGPAVRPPSG